MLQGHGPVLPVQVADLVGGALLLARITRKSVAELGLAPGLPVFAQVKSIALLQ